jgi:hypothetical protein
MCLPQLSTLSMANIQSLLTALTARQTPYLKVIFDRGQLLGYKLLTKRVPHVRVVKNGSQVVRYTVINEDLASTLGAAHINHQMMQVGSREGAQRSIIAGGDAIAQIGGSKDFLPPPSIVKDYEDLMKLKHGGTLRDSKGLAKSGGNLSPKQKVGMAMQRLEKLMRIKNQKFADKAGGNMDGSTDNYQFGVRKNSVESKRHTQ